MAQFFKYTLATILGIFISGFIGFFLMLGVIGVVVSSADESEVAIREHSILHLNLDYQINDRGSNDPFASMNFTDFSAKETPGLDDIVRAIEKAKDDPKIDGIYLSAPTVLAGMSSTQEIRDALENFKESGKFILAYATTYDQKGYYLASTATQLFLHPEGMILFRGLAGQVTFYKGALDMLGIEMQIIRHGQFKSAVEPFMLTKMSEANKKQTSALVNSIWGEMLKAISLDRKISLDDLNTYADDLVFNEAKAAEQYGFVDGLRYADEIQDDLVSYSEGKDGSKPRLVSVSKYIKTAFFNEEIKSHDKVAVIYASGEIKAGEGSDTYIGEENIVKALRKARENSKVKAVVLRVNSPGGSALVSDLIWREVQLTKAEKPVIASMSDVAASGGYYISCAANQIFAEPTTITGSIGVFGMIPNVQGLVTNKLGITFDEVKTNKNADFMDITKPLSPYQESVILKSIENTYSSFVTKVANGRNMSFEAVDAIGQGRVWTGEQALGLGLVDQLGGLEEAIAAAATAAELTNYQLLSLPVQKDPFTKLMEDLSGQSSVLLDKQFGEYARYIKSLQNLENADMIQARMPFDVEIN